MHIRERYLIRDINGRDVAIATIDTDAIREGAQIIEALSLAAIGDGGLMSGEYRLEFISIDRSPRPRPAARLNRLRPVNDREPSPC